MDESEGIYLLAAGSSSKNRKKTLEKAWTLSDIKSLLPDHIIEKLNIHFPDGQGIYAWGANQRSFNELSQIKRGQFVVDVKNKEVVQLFKFCFWYKTTNTDLQNYFGWDSEKPISKRRPYSYVYFLSSPIKTRIRKKDYFQSAFGLTDNSQWLVGQKYFDKHKVKKAFERTQTNNIDEFLKISKNDKYSEPESLVQKPLNIINESKPDSEFLRPLWLEEIITQVEKLQKDTKHLERDHEDIVANLFQNLGYDRVSEIKFQRGKIDIRIDINSTPVYTIEVKANWAMSCGNKNYLDQAFSYANQNGTPFVIITNADLYCIYDRTKGLSYDEQFVGSFHLTKLTAKTLDLVENLKKQNSSITSVSSGQNSRFNNKFVAWFKKKFFN